MANKYLLDSSAWVEYLAGTPQGQQVDKIIKENSVSTCIISIAELSDKFAKESQKFENEILFVKNSSAILNISINSCTLAGKLKMERRKSKKDFGLIDALIYLTAKENSCILVTKDSDFEDMDNTLIIG